MFVGSGAVEGGCKTIIGPRIKQSGMHWTVRGADAIIALRCQRRQRPLGPDLAQDPQPDEQRLTWLTGS